MREFDYLDDVRNELEKHITDHYICNLVSEDVDKSEINNHKKIFIYPGDVVSIQDIYTGGINSGSPYIQSLEDSIMIEIIHGVESDELNNSTVKEINDIRAEVRNILMGYIPDEEISEDLRYPLQFESSSTPDIIDKEIVSISRFTKRKVVQRT